MKILHVIPSLDIGGTEKTLLVLCRSLKAKGFDFRIAALKGGGAAAEALKEAGFPVVLLQSPDGFFGGALDFIPLTLRLRREIKGFSPDLVHTWLTRANTVGRLAARFSGRRPVISSLRVMEEEKSYHLWAERFLQGLCRTVTVNSAELKRFARQRIGIPAEKIVLIPNGIDASPGPSSSAAALRSAWAAPGQFLIGGLGRLHRQKGFDVFLRAAARIAKLRPECRFVIAGDGPERENLKALAKSLGIETAVSFAGWVPKSLDFLSVLDLFVFPSRWEGLPNAVLEAMLCGKPVVCTPAGSSGLIEDGRDGLVVPAENAAEISAAAVRMFGDPELRSRLGRAAREKVLKEYTLEGMILSYEKLYRSFEN
jgi:glycosyltransferase involved in cell wall biosynthesis